jgi:dGTPase
MEKPRLILEQREEKELHPCATRSSQSIGRTLHGEEQDDFRTCFQRDRDRILYSSAFKMLQYKTQVFMVHEGDFYRTRLTHTLEVMQHSRTLARALRANEDLCESIALGHDLGHSPFGHAGETALKEITEEHGMSFDHNLHSLRVVDKLERKYQRFNGLNLCYETREGMVRHETPYDSPRTPDEFKRFPSPSLEAQIVNIADPLAYLTHDIEDALNAKFLTVEQLNEIKNPLWDEACEGIENKKNFAEIIRNIINILSKESIAASFKGLQTVKSIDKLRAMPKPIIDFPQKRASQVDELQNFLYEEIYSSPQALVMAEKGKKILKDLFEVIYKNPKILPRNLRQQNLEDPKTKVVAVIDYLAGLTDRYAMDLYNMLFEPYEKVMVSFRD